MIANKVIDLMTAMRDTLRAEQEPPTVIQLAMIVTHDRGNNRRSLIPCEWQVDFEAEKIGAGPEALYCPTSTPPERCLLCGHIFFSEERDKMDAYMLELALEATSPDEEGDEEYQLEEGNDEHQREEGDDGHQREEARLADEGRNNFRMAGDADDEDLADDDNDDLQRYRDDIDEPDDDDFGGNDGDPR